MYRDSVTKMLKQGNQKEKTRLEFPKVVGKKNPNRKKSKEEPGYTGGGILADQV